MTKKKTKTKKSVGCSVKSMDRADGVLSSNFVCFYRSAPGAGVRLRKDKKAFHFFITMSLDDGVPERNERVGAGEKDDTDRYL